MKSSKLTGQALREWREKKGLTRIELSEKIGLSEGTLHNYEHENRCDTERKVFIPLIVAWAIAAVHEGLKPFLGLKKEGGSDVDSSNT